MRLLHAALPKGQDIVGEHRPRKAQQRRAEVTQAASPTVQHAFQPLKHALDTTALRHSVAACWAMTFSGRLLHSRSQVSPASVGVSSASSMHHDGGWAFATFSACARTWPVSVRFTLSYSAASVTRSAYIVRAASRGYGRKPSDTSSAMVGDSRSRGYWRLRYLSNTVSIHSASNAGSSGVRAITHVRRRMVLKPLDNKGPDNATPTHSPDRGQTHGTYPTTSNGVPLRPRKTGKFETRFTA
jgi:hypothetical protein